MRQLLIVLLIAVGLFGLTAHASTLSVEVGGQTYAMQQQNVIYLPIGTERRVGSVCSSSYKGFRTITTCRWESGVRATSAGIELVAGGEQKRDLLREDVFFFFGSAVLVGLSYLGTLLNTRSRQSPAVLVFSLFACGATILAALVILFVKPVLSFTFVTASVVAIVSVMLVVHQANKLRVSGAHHLAQLALCSLYLGLAFFEFI